MNASQGAPVALIIIVLISVVALAVVVAIGFLGFLRLRERRSNHSSLPSGMNSDPTRFARYDEEGEDHNA